MQATAAIDSDPVKLCRHSINLDIAGQAAVEIARGWRSVFHFLLPVLQVSRSTCRRDGFIACCQMPEKARGTEIAGTKIVKHGKLTRILCIDMWQALQHIQPIACCGDQ